MALGGLGRRRKKINARLLVVNASRTWVQVQGAGLRA